MLILMFCLVGTARGLFSKASFTLWKTAFYPSSCTVLSAGQLPRAMYTRLMLSINGVSVGNQMVPPCVE